MKNEIKSPEGRKTNVMREEGRRTASVRLERAESGRGVTVNCRRVTHFTGRERAICVTLTLM